MPFNNANMVRNMSINALRRGTYHISFTKKLSLRTTQAPPATQFGGVKSLMAGFGANRYTSPQLMLCVTPVGFPGASFIW